MPASATIETWVADDGYLVSFVADGLRDRRRRPDDRHHQRERPGQRGGAPRADRRPNVPQHMSRILVLGGSGEMGSAAVADLVARTDHEVTVGDIRTGRRRGPAAPARGAGAGRPRGRGGPGLAGRRPWPTPMSSSTPRTCATTCGVTDAAIAAGVHLVDLGSYYPETLAAARPARRRRGGRLPDRPRLRRGARPDQHPRPARRRPARPRRAIRMYSYITHPMWTSPGIVVTRFDASTGTSLVREAGELVEHPSFSGAERFDFPRAVRRAGGPPRPPPGAGHAGALDGRRRRRLQGRLSGRRDPAGSRSCSSSGSTRDEPFEVDGATISPRRFASAYIGRRGIGPDEVSANVKHVRVEGVRDGRP